MRCNVLFKGRNWLIGLSLLLASSVLYSCKDDFSLDNERPGFLGGSIYSELSSKPGYSTIVKLIDDLNYAEVLNQTGSKTIFAADDNAYADFFAKTTWVDANGNPVRSYEQLTTAQKNILLNSSMLDNAYLIELLTNVNGPQGLRKDVGLRQASSLRITDSIPYIKWNELPQRLSVDSTEVDLWMNYNGSLGTPHREGIYLAMDNTPTLFTHFIIGQMNTAKITPSDFKKVMGKEWNESDVYAYDAKVIQRDKTCLNGYVHYIDKVIVTPSNMAEVIRTNGKTTLFSAMLERFSAPVYDGELSKSYKQLNENADSVFVKRYYSLRSKDGSAFEPSTTSIAKGSGINVDMPKLPFDPGWNSYFSAEAKTLNSLNPAYEDMAAMFVPSDEALTKYFLEEGGKDVLKDFVSEAGKVNDEAHLKENLNLLPLKIIQQLVSNLMKSSFNASVPSKYLTIKNDARDNMFPETSFPNVQAFENAIDTPLLANNGVVYVMNKVIAPASFSAVLAPALFDKRANIVNAVVSADDDFIQGNRYNDAPLKKYFSTYLKAMQSHFSFFVPTDEALKKYYDPISAQRGKSRCLALQFVYEKDGRNRVDNIIPVRTKFHNYDPNTGVIDEDSITPVRLNQFFRLNADKIKKMQRQALSDMVDQHIVIHGDPLQQPENEIDGDIQEYYFARNGAPIHIKQSGKLEIGKEIEGGWQIDFNKEKDTIPGFEPQRIKVVAKFDKTAETNKYGNGWTYFIDRPIQATVHSVYSHLNGDTQYNDFTEFGKLCNGFDKDIIEKAGFLDSIDKNRKTLELTKYEMFTNKNTPNKRISFFGNSTYTIYVPTNEALNKAITEQHLPTWESIKQYIDDNAIARSGKTEKDSLAKEHKIVAQAMVTCLINFLKYHFQDKSVFNDKMVYNNRIAETSSYDEKNRRFLRLAVTSQGKDQMTVTRVYQEGGEEKLDINNQCKIIAPNNVFARDMQFDSDKENALGIFSSAFVVMHQIDKCLNFSGKTDFRELWSTPAMAKKFVQQYRIKNS